MDFFLEKLRIDASIPDEQKGKIFFDNPIVKKLVLKSSDVAEARWFYLYQELVKFGMKDDLVGAIKYLGVFLTTYGYGPEHFLSYPDDALREIMKIHPEIEKDFFTPEFIQQFSQAMIRVMAKIEKEIT